jgi:methionyl-tRNA formyltransferase
MDRLSEQDLARLGVLDKYSLGISFGSPYIFRAAHISGFRGNLINSHGAPLPSYKGGGGYSWRILNGDKRGCSLMHIVSEEIDKGEVVFRNDFLFSEYDRRPIDYEKSQLSHENRFLVPWLTDLIAGRVTLSPLSSEETVCLEDTYFPRLHTDTHGFIDWNWSADAIQRFILAFSEPYSGARSFLKGKSLRIWDCSTIKRQCHHPFVRGIIVDVSSPHIMVATRDALVQLRLSDIRFDSEACAIIAGDRFYTPSSYLEDSLHTRVFYKPQGPIFRSYDQRGKL